MTLLKDYLADKRYIVRINGVEFCKLSEQDKLAYANYDMGNEIVKREPFKLITVNSRDPSRPVFALGRLSEEVSGRPSYSTDEQPKGRYLRGTRTYESGSDHPYRRRRD